MWFLVTFEKHLSLPPGYHVYLMTHAFKNSGDGVWFDGLKEGFQNNPSVYLMTSTTTSKKQGVGVGPHDNKKKRKKMEMKMSGMKNNNFLSEQFSRREARSQQMRCVGVTDM
ncbi:hypothetical protein JTE90_001732 [Oedothorax gibbosus]|uniref:Uncharacterized protein n=1 Tax=Oedothorax gibbosus TaxID=931172 RepID=A0AAV6V8R6_9ARAC|nr:hypothetical protein JTE90_001732 [Oedothorax gibbosus]